jgi:hypothetical protein
MRYANEYVSSLYDYRRHGKLRPLGLDDASTRFHRTGLGFPVVSSNAERYFSEVLEISRKIWDSGCDQEWIAHLFALAGYRGQPLGPPHEVRNPGGYAKTRFIYMMPRALANLEKCIQAVLLDALKANPAFCAWDSTHAVDKQMTSLLSSGRRVLSIDFSKFDQSVPNEVLSKVYHIFRLWFVPEAEPLIDFAEEVMKRTGIIIPDVDGEGGAYECLPGSARTGGICSGSVMTNMSGSHVNAWVMAYAARKLKTSIRQAYFQGDDGVIDFQSTPSMADIAGVLHDDLGMTLSVKKSRYEVGSITFLQNVHDSDFVFEGLNVGVRPIMQACMNMSCHEKMTDSEWRSDDYETIRFCQQLSYAIHHPCVTEAADWLADADVYARDILRRVMVDPLFFEKACAAVRRKDSNSQKGFSPNALMSSPVFQYMLAKV